MTSETIVPLRWSDMDAMGHVNNAAYLTFLETAREPWFAALGADNDLMQFALRRVEIDYLSQLRFEDGAVRVTVSLGGVGTTSIRTREVMTAESDGRLVVEASTVIVRLDETGTTSAPLPDDVRARLSG